MVAGLAPVLPEVGASASTLEEYAGDLRHMAGAVTGAATTMTAGVASWEGLAAATLSWALRWLSVPGLLGAFGRADEYENEAKRRLDEWGGGRTDTLTNRAVYGTGTVLSIAIPGPSGKAGAATAAARAAGHLGDVDSAVAAAIPDDAAWVGGGGVWLRHDELSAVENLHAHAVLVEPSITRLIDDVVVDIPTAHVVGRQYVLKSPESLSRKVAQRLLDAGPARAQSVAPIVGSINDAVRYTVVSSRGTLVRDTNDITETLRVQGFVCTQWKSTWGGHTYQGINSTWRSPDGQLFELQFHTPSSHWAKEYTHSMYEEWRLLDPSTSAALELDGMQGSIFSQVGPPQALGELTDPRK